MIRIEHLTKQFKDVKAVNDLSINIDKGINGLVGENGAGKSTLLRLIADVYSLDGGTITIDDKPYNNLENKRNLFFLPDNPYVDFNSNVMQTFELYSSLFDIDRDNFFALLDKLSLPKDRRVSTFSKGMKRQLFICLALSMKAEYILLDEAFDGLDPLVLDVIKQEIIKFADKKTFIVSSHNISSLERLCDNFIILSRGRLGGFGDIEDIAESFTKYQIFSKDEITEEDLNQLGYRVLSYKKFGSILNVVFYDQIDETPLRNKFDIVLLERIPIDPDELITLQMLSARKGDK